jgi:ubiquinone/menaquinone biosynthesis C-methylase UbiE
VNSPQVAAEHYRPLAYDTKARWVSYWQQAHEVLAAAPENCLEVGVGNGTVRRTLEASGIEVVTVDLDPALEPDRVGDVRALPCEDGEFDVALCAQVLEHLPFGDVRRALAEIHRVCRRRAIVSVPLFGRYLELAFRLPPFRRVAWIGRLPSRHAFRFDGQHYWEMGARNAPMRAVRALIAERFAIAREYTLPENPYHRFFVLDRRY